MRLAIILTLLFSKNLLSFNMDSLTTFNKEFIVELNKPLSSLNSNFKTISSTEPDDSNPKATMLKYEFDFGKIIITVWNDTISQVIYNIYDEDKEKVKEKNELLNNFYAGNSSWVKLGESDFGYWSETKDKQFYSSYSYMDINTYGIVKFKESLNN